MPGIENLDASFRGISLSYSAATLLLVPLGYAANGLQTNSVLGSGLLVQRQCEMRKCMARCLSLSLVPNETVVFKLGLMVHCLCNPRQDLKIVN